MIGEFVEREIWGQAPIKVLFSTWSVDCMRIVRAEYVYNGLNWRIIKRADTGGTVGELNQERRMYYSANWQLLEEEIDEDAAQSGFSVDRRMQYVWGTPGSGYIDDIIMRRQDSNDDGTFDQTWYHITDTLFSTVAILDDSGKIVERVSYDAYGGARHHRAGDLDGDGAADGTDQSILLGTDWGGYGVGDFNRDGVVGIPDLLFFNGVTGAALPPGRLSLTDNVVGYAGYIFNAEFNWSSGAGLYTVRHRHHAPELGRWLSRDPLGYVDGMSLYEYVKARPADRTDPTGKYTCAVCPGVCSRYEWCARNWTGWCDRMGQAICGQRQDDKFNTRHCTSVANDMPLSVQSGACDSYVGVTVHPFVDACPICVSPRCVCQCMGNGRWQNRIRACLRCMIGRGVDIMHAHKLCFKAFGWNGVQMLTPYGPGYIPSGRFQLADCLRRCRRSMLECSIL